MKIFSKECSTKIQNNEKKNRIMKKKGIWFWVNYFEINLFSLLFFVENDLKGNNETTKMIYFHMKKKRKINNIYFIFDLTNK